MCVYHAILQLLSNETHVTFEIEQAESRKLRKHSSSKLQLCLGRAQTISPYGSTATARELCRERFVLLSVP